MKKVIFCNNSTITEAWVVIFGLPSERTEEEEGAIALFGKKRFGDLKKIPAFVLIEQPKSGPSPPFWSQQFTWDNELIMARVGHRYLSVHYVRKGDDCYQTYHQSLKPAVKDWLDVYEETLFGSDDKYLLDGIGFGYVNTFLLPADDFDLSTYFRIDLGIGIEAAQTGLVGLQTNFRFIDSEYEASIVVNLLVNTGVDGGAKLQVQTKISAERKCKTDWSFKDKEAILEEIISAKEIAKATFFNFATDETHKIMEAQYASD